MRLRVSRSELAHFQAGGRIEETIRFAKAAEAKLTYALESAVNYAAFLTLKSEACWILASHRAKSASQETTPMPNMLSCHVRNIA